MRDELKDKISKDLKISKFKKESFLEYHQRLIYSALSMWVRSLIMGNSVNDYKSDVEDVENVFPDIGYVQYNLSKVAEAFLMVYPCNMDWLEIENIPKLAMKLAGRIIQDMIYLNEIGEVMERKLSLVPDRKAFWGGYMHEYGLNTFNKNTFVLGCSLWSENVQNEDDTNKIISIGGMDYYKYMVKKFPWKKADVKGNFELFKVGVTGKDSKSWIPYDSGKIKEGINILRDTNTFEPGYMLVKKEKDNLYVVWLDPWYRKSKEIYRIMYALNAANGIPAQFRTKIYDDYIVLHDVSALPDEEKRLILSISWPYSTYHDYYSRIIPIKMWDLAQNTIEKLGAAVVN